MKKGSISDNQAAALHPNPLVNLNTLSSSEMRTLLLEMQKRQVALVEQCDQLTKAEKEVRDKYTRILDFTPIGLALLDQHSIVLEANPSFCNLLQLNHEQVAGKSFSALVAEDQKEIYETFCRKLLRSRQKHSCNLLLQNGDGHQVEVQLQGKREVTANGGMQLRLAVSEAASNTKAGQAGIAQKLKASLKRSEMLLRETQAIAHVGSFEYDMEHDALEWSDEMYRVHGLEPGEIQPSLIYLIKHTFVDDQVLVRDTLYRAFRSKIPFSITRRFLRPDGALSYIHVTGRFYQAGSNVKLIGTAQDITTTKKIEAEIKQKNEELVLANRKLRNEIEGRQQVEQALMESEEKWRTLVENTPDVIARFDSDLRHVFVNSAVEHETGLKPELCIGKTHQEMNINPEFYEPYLNMIKEVFRTGQQTQAYTFFDTRAGRKYYYSITVPEFGPERKVKTVLSISRDVTEAKQKENLLSGVLNSSIHGIAALRAIRDAQHRITDFEWVLVNKPAEAILQRNAKQLAGKTLLDVLPSHKESGLFDSFVNTINTGETFSRIIYYDYDHLKAWYQIVAVKLEDGLVVTFADINDLKITEEKLRKREAELMEAQEVGHLGSWSYNLKKNKFSCSKELERILGVPRNSINSLNSFIEHIHPQDRTPMQDLISKAIIELQPFAREYRFVRPDGTIRWISGRGKIMRDQAGIPIRLASSGQDVTELKQAERLVKQQKELNESIIEHIVDGISAFDMEGTYNCWNRALGDYTGLKRQDVIGRKIFDIFPYIRNNEVGQKFRDVLQGKRGEIKKAPFLVRNGFYEAHFVPTYDSDHQQTGGLCIIHDITESIKLKEVSIAQELTKQREVSNAVLEAQEEERKRIAELLHHGLEQLLFGIKLHLEQLATVKSEKIKQLEEQEISRLVHAAIREARALSFELIPRILEDFGLEIALKELCRRLSGPRLQLKLKRYCCTKELESSFEIAVYRILQELVNNVARKAHATEGSIEVQCIQNQIRLEVSDNSMGVWSDGDAVYEGIGLASIENRLKLLDGKMTVDFSNGTSIKITIPLRGDRQKKRVIRKRRFTGNQESITPEGE
ncbi:PAS domain S-box protein [Pontibacter ruber]|uniref:histidine kinase n=1 Tax=Pontibacter ruber TaxID=1343895 RepID=A0ABW5D185_9BACT|nr:PAS domain S-box protein [Pontibacter ruber]